MMDTDESTNKMNESSDLMDNERQKYFGIKSYLHNFYENVSFKNPSDYDECDDEYFVHHMSEKSKKRSIFWTIALIGGFTSMLCGSIMLVTGFMYPKLKIDVGYQEEMRIIDKSAYDFNEHLEQIKVIGLIFFAVGGISVASALLLPSLLPNNDYDDTDDSDHFKLQIDEDCKTETNDCNQNLIPITEELKIIQPKQEKTTVITNAGLKHIQLE